MYKTEIGNKGEKGHRNMNDSELKLKIWIVYFLSGVIKGKVVLCTENRYETTYFSLLKW